MGVNTRISLKSIPGCWVTVYVVMQMNEITSNFAAFFQWAEFSPSKTSFCLVVSSIVCADSIFISWITDYRKVYLDRSVASWMSLSVITSFSGSSGTSCWEKNLPYWVIHLVLDSVRKTDHRTIHIGPKTTLVEESLHLNFSCSKIFSAKHLNSWSKIHWDGQTNRKNPNWNQSK